MKIVFMGSPEFAVPTLRAVMARHQVVAAVCQPDKPAGRGMQVTAPPVKQVAAAAGIPVLQPKSAKTPEFVAELRALAPDVAVVVAYGKILPQAVLDVPRHGCLNVHASLLPRHRGAAPIQWALIRGDDETGVTIMRLDAGMDTGPMLLVRKLPIAPQDTAGTLHDKLGAIGADLMVEALDRLERGTLSETPQDDALATKAPMLQKETGRLDFTVTARQVRDIVRGTDPWPGAYTTLDGETLKVFGARLAEGRGAPGEVLGVDREGLVVACGEGAVAFAELQLPGRKRLPAKALVAGRPIPPGTRLS
jgi:methionyl-tRNA formyltransferase